MPQNWKTYKLGKICTIKYGKDHKKLEEGNIPCYGTGGIMRYVETALSEDESVLIPRKGSLNNIYYIDEPFWTVDTLFWTKIDKEILFPRFFYYNLKTLDFASKDVGSAIPSLTTSLLNEIEINLPPLQEQKSIASILSALDDKIENNLAMNKTLEEMAMALYKHWFVDFGPFQSGNFIDSELGPIPEGWEVKTVGDATDVIGGYAFKSKDFQDDGEAVIKIKNIGGNVVALDGCSFVSSSVASKTNPKFEIAAGSFLIAMTGAEVGKVGIVPDYGRRLWLNQRVGMITSPKFKHADVLIGNFLQSNEGYQTIQNLAYGSAQPNISTTGIESVQLPLPNNKEILELPLLKLNSWHQQKVANRNENITLTQLRDTLLPKLISGEVRVKEATQTVANAL